MTHNEVIFENTAKTTLTILEKDLLGTYALISINYIISPKEGSDIEFTGSDIINIGQDNTDVIMDIGTSSLLLGAEVKAGVTIVRLLSKKEFVNALKNAWPYIIDFIRRAWGEIDE